MVMISSAGVGGGGRTGGGVRKTSGVGVVSSASGTEVARRK